MTQDTRAEALRRMIALEDEMNGLPLSKSPGVERILQVFLERLHHHEINVGDFHTGCYLCTTADKMIKEFK